MAGELEEQLPLIRSETIESTTPARRKIVDALPLVAWAIISVEICERFAYFGLTGPLQNYAQLSDTDPVRPGGLGLGQRYATLVKTIFVFWCYTTPIAAAVVADQYLGRLKTILYSTWVYLLGLVMLWWSSTRALSLDARRQLLLPAMLLISLGTGGIKTNANALLAEQYQAPANGLRKLKSGEVVAIDYAATVQRIIMTAYVMTNIGALSPVLTTYVEASPSGGFSPAFMLPLFAFILGIIILYSTKRHYKVRPPADSVVLNAAKVLLIASQYNWTLSSARPSLHPTGSAPCLFGRTLSITYDEDFPRQVKAALQACFIFASFPVYWAAYLQMLSNFISQAGTMDDHGIPNDLLVLVSTISIVVMVPLLDLVLYPWLRRYCLEPLALTKIRVGYLLCSASMAWAAVVQATIYGAPPCYQYPRTGQCPEANHVHIALQVPAYLLLACSEILVSTTGLQLAFTRAPPTMRSLIMSVFLSTCAMGALLSTIFTPLMQHPRLVWLFGSIAIMVGVVGLTLPFWMPSNEIPEQIDAM